MYKRALALILTLTFIFSLAGCVSSDPASQDGVVNGSGTLSFSSSSSSQEELDPESPPADGEGPVSSESVSPSSSSSSSSVPPSSSSSAPPSSSSSVAPPSSSSEPDEEPEEPDDEVLPPSGGGVTPSDEVRGVWLSYLDLAPMITGRTKAQFTSSIRTAFSKIADMGLNTVYAQVRPFGDALYPSDYFPQSYLFTGKEGEVGQAPFDALAIMVSEAHAQGLSIEAWLNPYRVRASGTLGNKALSASNPARGYWEDGSDVVVEYENGLFYNPGSAEARQLIVSGVEEIVNNYDVDGIHFDDYFYPPNASAAFDRETYQNSGTTKNLGDWRREQVNILVKQVYNAVGSGKVFGISPAGNNSNNRNMLYCDVATWVSNPGYVDYLCPQVYFGFNNATCPYKDTVKLFNNLISTSGVKLYVGLAAYKVGDSAQGSEWVGAPTMMRRQVEFARTQSRYGGFALYRYDSIMSASSQMKQEMANLQSIL